MEDNYMQEDEISLRELFETIRKRIVLIISITILALGASGMYTYFFITPVYQTSTQVLVSKAATGSFLSEAIGAFNQDSQYIDTYNVILKSPYILNQVIEEIGLDRSHNQLNKQINVSQEGRSQVVTIRIQDTNPVLAVEIANVTAEVFQREIANLLKIDNIHILSSAELLAKPIPISPNPKLNMAIGMVLGLMVSVGLAFLLEFLDNSIRSEEDIERILGLAVLGAVPEITKDEDTYNTNHRQQQKHTIGGESIGS